MSAWKARSIAAQAFYQRKSRPDAFMMARETWQEPHASRIGHNEDVQRETFSDRALRLNSTAGKGPGRKGRDGAHRSAMVEGRTMNV